MQLQMPSKSFRLFFARFRELILHCTFKSLWNLSAHMSVPSFVAWFGRSDTARPVEVPVGALGEYASIFLLINTCFCAFRPHPELHRKGPDHNILRRPSPTTRFSRVDMELRECILEVNIEPAS